MLHINTLTKKGLEKIIKKIFTNFGPYYSSQALDSLKLLGFFYATASGISINIEDLRVPVFKQSFLKEVSKNIFFISKNWKKGNITEIERFANIINSWSIASETLKKKIVGCFKSFEPSNNLYFMAISGARGNMDQVRQLIGIRGLMSDQDGQIIDLPIRDNFREGLSPIDYVISSYGARKGIVDTALKTASSGYLTRRLVYVAQDLVIRKFDCNTKRGIFLFINKKIGFNDILGRILLSIMPLKSLAIKIVNKNVQLNAVILKHISNTTTLLSIRSPLTCEIKNSICQNCYGWNLAKNKLINLGDDIGIIAAHSLSEPATQLTMRTFHSGGVFTNESLKQLVMPFSGIISIPIVIKKNISKNFFGNPTYRIHKPSIITIKNWEGKKETIHIESGSIINIIKTKFIKKNDLISEYSKKNGSLNIPKKTPIYSHIGGEIHMLKKRKNLINDKISYKNFFLIKSAKIIKTPNDTYFHSNKIHKVNVPFATLNIMCPTEGFFVYDKDEISIISKKIKSSFKFKKLKSFYKNYKTKFITYLCNYQFLDKYTIFGFFNFYLFFKEALYKRKKLRFNSIYFKIHSLLVKTETWKIDIDQNTNLLNKIKYKFSIFGIPINQIIKSGTSGYLIKKEGHKLTYQNIYFVNANKRISRKKNKNSFIFKKELLFNIANPVQATLDITQGLPKLEAIFEARTVKNKLTLAECPGIFINPDARQNSYNIKFDKDLIIYNVKKLFTNNLNVKSKHLEILHTNYNSKNVILYKNKIWAIFLLPKEFSPILLKNYFGFIKGNSLLNIVTYRSKYYDRSFTGFKKLIKNWSFKKVNNNNNLLNYKFINKKSEISYCKSFQDVCYFYYNMDCNDLIYKLKKDKYLYLKPKDFIREYEIKYLYSKKFRVGSFIDIAEPISLLGLLDPRNLLQILFNYHTFLDGIIKGTIKSINKFQLILVNSIQSIYQSQNIEISSKNIDIIIRQLTNKVEIINGGSTPYISGETFSTILILEVIKVISLTKNIKIPNFQPKFVSSINSSLNKNSFLTTSSFQQAKKMLSKAAIHGKSDWLIGLKERIVVGAYLSSGTTFLNNTKNLDIIYLFKKKIS